LKGKKTKRKKKRKEKRKTRSKISDLSALVSHFTLSALDQRGRGKNVKNGASPHVSASSSSCSVS
jgi:hypothetical protein